MYTHLVFYIFILLLFVTTSKGQDRSSGNADLYILMGQSNMAGRGSITNELKKEINDSVFVLNKDGQWVIARHPLHFDKPKAAGVGPGLGFGIRMSEAAHKRIGLIPCAVGGTTIERWVPGAFDPATGTHPYDDAVKRIKAAMNFGTIKGVIWHQGESNSAPEKAVEYLEQLKEIIERIRKLVNDPNLPFVAGELGRFFRNASNINAELQKLPKTVKYTAVVSSANLNHKGDFLHFDGPSADELGRRYAEQMLRIKKFQ